MIFSRKSFEARSSKRPLITDRHPRVPDPVDPKGDDDVLSPVAAALQLDRHLEPGEVSHMAMWSYWGGWARTVLLVTDRRVIHAREGAFTPLHVTHQCPLADVVRASYHGWILFGRVTIHRRGRLPFWVMFDTDRTARAFVDELGRMVGTRR